MSSELPLQSLGDEARVILGQEVVLAPDREEGPVVPAEERVQVHVVQQGVNVRPVEQAGEKAEAYRWRGRSAVTVPQHRPYSRTGLDQACEIASRRRRR